MENCKPGIPIPKFLMYIMRVVVLLFTFCVLHTYAVDSYAQNTNLTLKENEVELENLLKKIEENSEFYFFYSNDLIDKSMKVSIDVQNKTIFEILDAIFNNTKLSYEVNNKAIILSYREAINSIKQEKIQINGRVISEQGDPIIGANIIEKGTINGTVTDIDGNFSIDVESNAILQISYIGFLAQEINIIGRKSFVITLVEDLQTLDEFIVVGYGTIQKRHLTGAVGSIKMDENIGFLANSEFGQAMYGKVPGVQILNTSGRPGVSSTVQIRGINSISANATPLIVIDGIIIPEFDLNSINASDIESIDILKDAASSSIYGSRGANGVILVTTRSGKTGKPRLTVNHSSSIQKVVRRIDVMNSAEYAAATIDAAQNGWVDKGGDPNAPNTIEARGEYKYTWPEPMNNPSELFDTNWHDVVFRIAPIHKTDVNLSGGDNSTTYYFSGGVLLQDGILINTDYQKYSLSFKVDSNISKWLKIGGGVSTNIDKENRGGNTTVHTLTSASQYPPVYPIYGSDGYLGGPQNTPGFENHVNVLFRVHHGHPYHRGGGRELYDVNRKNYLGNVYGEVLINKDLKFKSSFNAFIRDSHTKHYINADTGQGPTVLRQASTTVTQNEIFSYTSSNQLNYNRNINNHQLDAIVGYEFTKREFYELSASRRDYDNDLVPYLRAGKTVYGASDQAYESALISAFGRVNYNYLGKYMASISMRGDGSSRFGPQHKWGYFPSISLGWRLSEEKFFNSIEKVNNLNFRISYGYTGNENIGDYRWISSMNQGRMAIGNTPLISYYPSSIENPELKWEKTRQLNMGFDLGLLNNKFVLETDIFKSNSEDLLLDVPVPSITGFNSVFRNIGEVENIGIESKFSSNQTFNNLFWNSFITISSVRNKIKSLGQDDAPIYYSPGNAMETINMVGQPIFSYYGLKYDGVYKNQAEIDNDPASYENAKPGNGKYKDINGDGIIDSSDRVIIGSYQPDFVWAFSNTFRYKNFDLSFLFQGVVGMDIFDENIHRSWMYHEGRNYHRKMLNRWRSEDNPGDGYIPKLTVDLAKFDLTSSSYFIQDGSYLRLQEVNIGFNVPEKITQKMQIERFRVYLNGTNLLLFTKSTVYDPENFKSNASDLVRRGANFSEYPSAKVISLGINVQF